MHQIPLFDMPEPPEQPVQPRMRQSLNDKADELIERFLADSSDVKTLLMHLQLKTLWNLYLSKLSHDEQMRFVAMLIDQIQG